MTQSHTEAAVKILSYLGYSQEATREEGADAKMDKLVEIISQTHPAKAELPFLANGTRYKVSSLEHGTAILGLPDELSGEWVVLIKANNDEHLKCTHLSNGRVSTKDSTDEISRLKAENEALKVKLSDRPGMICTAGASVLGWDYEYTKGYNDGIRACKARQQI